MKIAVILTEFLKDYVKSYYDSCSLGCELTYFTYSNFSDAGELYLQFETEYDGFLVSGPVPRAAICRKIPVLNRPIVSFGSNALCYYETFFQIQYQEQDFYLKKGYFDLMEWYHDPETKSLYEYLRDGCFNQLLYEIYQNTSSYSLEQLCNMEENIKSKHIRLWKEGKINYSVTRFSNIMPDLLAAGVRTYFVYPKHEILQESINILLQEIHLKSMLQNQTAITALNQRLTEPALTYHSQSDSQIEIPRDQSRQVTWLSNVSGLSVSYAHRLLTALMTLDHEHITSQNLASALHITPRSANRLLVRLSGCGIAEPLSVKASPNRGRPEKIYRLHLKI